MSPTLARRRDQLRALYGFDFPEDLFHFWKFVNSLRPLEPLRALHDALEVELVGPFEVLAGRFDGRTPRYAACLHWRYYSDPPEFFTVLTGGGDGYHAGYWLDDPRTEKGSVASYFAEGEFEITNDGENLFEAVRLHLEVEASGIDVHSDDRPPDAESRALADRIDRLRCQLRRYATDDRPETGEEYYERYAARAARSRRQRIVAATQEGMGIVVHPELYRPLSLKDRALWRRLWNDDDPSESVEEARQALRDGFPGTALKLGKDLRAVGGDNKSEWAFNLLDAAYAALGRDVLREVLRAHRTHRDRPWLDVLQEDG
jgi:hypothetical protein